MMRLLFVAVVTLWACGSDEPSSSPSPLVDASDASTGGDVSTTECPAGHIAGSDGECMAVGIQGCDDMFIDPDTGLCDPSLVDCPPGHIPIFGGDDQGCRPVGIQGCDDMFIDPETGMCDPAYLECPPGQIPVFSGDNQGCRAIGIVDCHPDFFDAETGRCNPKEDACPEGSMAIPSQGCVSLDPPGGCGEGTWGNIEELPGDVHLDVNYAGDDSDGSREKPWTLFSQADAQVESGGRIVFAAGDYDQGILVSKSISLVGRCSSMVTISGVRDGTVGPTILEVNGDIDVTITDLSLSGDGRGIVARFGAQLLLSRAHIRNTQIVGLRVEESGTHMTADQVWISGTRTNEADLGGSGITVSLAASMTLLRSHVSDNHTVGIAATGLGTSVITSEVWVSGTRPDAGDLGFGILVQGGASMTLSKSRVSDNHDMSIRIIGSETTLEATEVWVSGTKLNGAGEGGYGVYGSGGASINISRSCLSDNHSTGLLALDVGTTLTANELWVSSTQQNAQGLYGFGIEAGAGSSVSVSRSRVSDNDRTGLVGYSFDSLDTSSTLTISEVWVSGRKTNAQGTFGYGIDAAQGVILSLSRSRVSDTHNVGVVAQDSGTTVTASEVWVSGTRSAGEGGFGRGIVVQNGASLSVIDSRISDNDQIGILVRDAGSSLSVRGSHVVENRSVGIAAYLGASVTVSDVWVSGTQPIGEGDFGRGIMAQDGASLSVIDSRISDNDQIGVFAVAGSSLSVRGSHVFENRSAAVSIAAAGGSVIESLLEGTKPGGQLLGDGLLVTGSVVTVERVISRNNSRAGALFDKSDGEISGSLLTQNAIGLANQGLPGATVADDNVIEGNDQDRLDDGGLEVPDDAMALPE